MKAPKNSIYYLLILLLLVIGIFISLMINRDISIKQAEERAARALSDSAREQIVTFKAKTEGQFSILEAFAGYAAKYKALSFDELRAFMEYVVKAGSFYHLGYAEKATGRAYLSIGEFISVSDRLYYREALAGRQCMQIIDENRVDTLPLFVMSTPIYENGEITAVAFCSYDLQKLGELMSTHSYGGEGFSFVCDSNGYIIISSESDSLRLISDIKNKSFSDKNILEWLLNGTASRGGSEENLSEDLKNGISGTVFYRIESGAERFAFYMPIGINDWTLFNVIPSMLIDAEINAVTKASILLTFFIMFSVLLFFLFIVLREKKNNTYRASVSDSLRIIAERDKLTGLYNRDTFIEKAQEFISGKPADAYVMIYFDIDNFKIINDILGYAEGNNLLCIIADDMRKFMGERGIYCRISADYFALIYPNAANLFVELKKAGEKLETDVRISLSISISFGVYIIDDTSLPINSILDRAALAQRSVKGQYGTLYAVYDKTMRDRLLEVQEVLISVGAALERKEFVLYFQPQYNYKTGKITGAEALVRWNHPEKGLVFPNAFIPIIEQSGFISKLDFYVWEETCKFIRRWIDEGRGEIPISVNVSRVDVYDPKLCELMLGLIKKYDIPVSALRLEITESAYMKNPEQLVGVLSSLREAGFTIEMDDFGSGYSSLNMLKDAPIDVIKLDMRFLSDEKNKNQPTENERKSAVILKNTIQMAHDLGLIVIAEGVETKEQADNLMRFKCRMMQGYYYAKPMPVLEFEKLLPAPSFKEAL
ncbi:MAG: EAL domain-containing protein [Clostridia bacterium]